jgi:hypothetical protein
MSHFKISFCLAIFSYFLLLWIITNFYFHNKISQLNFTNKSSTTFINININQNNSISHNPNQKNNNITKKNIKSQTNPNKKSIDSNINTLNNSQEKNVSQERIILHQPLPKIPQDLQYELLNEKIIANFIIDKNGKPIKITLISPSKHPKLNAVLLDKLQEWLFVSQDKISSQDVLVNFMVTDL